MSYHIIESQPHDQETELGEYVVFSVQGSGGGENLTFQWYHSDALVATDEWLEIEAVASEDLGEYYVVVSDGATTLTSRTALLTLEDTSGQPDLGAVQFTPADNRPIPAAVALSVPDFPTAEIYYTVDGTIPTKSKGVLYSGPIQLSQPTTIIAFASMQQQNGPTAVQKIGYPIDPVRLVGNNQIGIPLDLVLLPFVADMTAVFGRPAAYGKPVTFTARSPSGSDLTSWLSKASDVTGSSGYPGVVSTYICCLSDETGVYTVTANCDDHEVTFEVETVTPVSVTGTDKNYVLSSSGDIEDSARMLISISGQRPNITHVFRPDLRDGGFSLLEETVPGSGLLVPTAASLSIAAATQSGGTKYASADFVKNIKSYWDDSAEFETRFSQADLSIWGFDDPKVSRGSARSPYRPEYVYVGGTGYPPIELPRPSGWLDVTRAFLRAAGYRTEYPSVLGTSTVRFVPDQAHILYISTHGYHATGKLQAHDGRFGAFDADWRKGLSVVVIAGCSVLDVTGSKPPWAGTPDANLAPGRKWAKTGPAILLGYESYAPPDRFRHWNGFSDAGPKQVVQTWIERMEIYWESPLYAWLYANWWYGGGVVDLHKSCHNACAIDAFSIPRNAYHLIGNPFGSFESNFREVPESQWAGEE